jgi:hypothetical protein
MNTITRIIAALLLLISIEGFSQVSVTATGGTLTGSYTTLNAAFAAINAGTHQGAINISVTANTTEPSSPTSLVGSGVGSASYSSIHISPSGGSWTVHSAALPFAYRGIIELFGAQHVTIDGDPTGTGTRHLTFEVAQTSDINTSAIRLGSTDTSGLTGAAYDTIRNCNIIGGRDSANSTTPSYDIIISGSSTSSINIPVAYGCSYNAFINNTFTRSNTAIYLLGTTSGTIHGNSSTLIRRNYFGTDSASTSNIYGIYAENYNVSDGSVFAVIDSNDFTGILTSSSYTFYGIYSLYNYGSLLIRGNNIHDINAPHGITGLNIYGGVSGGSPVYAPLDFSGNIMQNCTSSGSVTMIYQNVPATFTIPSQWNIYNNTINNIYSSTSNGNVLGGFVFASSSGSGGADTVNVYNNVITHLSGGCNIVGIAYNGTGKFSVHNNIINGLSTSNTNCFAVGIYEFVGTVYNNMVSDISAAPIATVTSSNPVYPGLVGIPASALGLEANGAGAYVYENSIALNTANQSGAAVNAFSAAVYYNNSRSRFEDNIVYNSQNSSNAYGFYASSTATFSSDTLDYNEYYVPYGNVGYAGSAESGLANWQAATSQDLHSVSGPVPFITVSNLHIDTLNATANNVFRNGTYLASVPVDIDGQTRNNPPCIGADEFNAVNALPDSLVWPGDADANRLVDNNDLLPIGLGYDSTGPVRTVGGIVWQGDLATNWANYFSIYSPTVNFNHADCNGDGIINADDTLAIVTNYGLTHAKTNNLPSPWRNGVPGLYIQIVQDTVLNNDTVTANIFLGDSATPVNNIYGLAFTFNYDPLVIDSNYSMFSFVSSWLGNSSNSININRNFATGQVQAAITGIDHIARSGNGQIATFVGEITTSNINGKTYSYYDNINYISNVTAIDQYGNPISLNAGIDSDYVGFFVNGIKPIATPTVSIYPNPAATQIRVSADAAISAVTITDMLGENVQTISTDNKKSDMIDISSLSDGVYIVHVSAAGATATAKLVVSR